MEHRKIQKCFSLYTPQDVAAALSLWDTRLRKHYFFFCMCVEAGLLMSFALNANRESKLKRNCEEAVTVTEKKGCTCYHLSDYIKH